ncbi:2OG-Fe(II) oxygenase [Qipengyuania sp. XHP0207]|uniref:prolyl hydroxylase family protein n=1 Tax=Qipengyuania sp. XHP0207 TaxID=3038078 RepID=UPI00241DBED4|nr:2OG-Fe(II) oxygenase [Qipengyuania sp. XHP0207]MDG5746674.1 2OG-Fe(II) oxygenase [Qipengyuania sp. XHP0207]
MALRDRLTRLVRGTPPDPMADPAELARIGDAVRARLRADPRAEDRGGNKADLFLVPHFLTSTQCSALVTIIESRLRPSTLFSESQYPSGRTSSTHFFATEARETKALGKMIDELLGIERLHAETIQGQRYLEGEEYRHHRDYFRRERPHWQQERRRGGQRSWSAMVYLNEVDAGGETEFPELDLTVTPEPGLLIAWNNMNRGGHPNRNTRHAALPVREGRKYVITQWYRQGEWSRNYR